MSISDNLTLTVNSPRAEQPVSGVAQAREDVAVVVELPVEGGRVHGDVGVGGEHRLHTLRRGDEAEEAHARGPGFLQGLHGSDGRAPGREHRVQHEKRPVLLARGDLEVVVDGLECVVVAVQADMSDARRGDELGDALDHPQAGAQDGDQGELLARHLHAAHMLERCIELDGLEGQVLGDLVGHEHRDLGGELLEVLGGRTLVAEQRELVLNQRVGQQSEVGEIRLRHGRQATARDATTLRRHVAGGRPGRSFAPPVPRRSPFMKRAISLLVFAAAVVPALAAQAPPSKRRVAVLDFDYATVREYVLDIFGRDEDIGKGIADMLVTDLVRNGTYSVIERKQLDRILQEQNFQQSGRADATSAVQLARILGVDAIIIGSITQFGRDDKKLGIGGAGVRVGGIGLGGIGRKTAKAVVNIDARIVSTTTAAGAVGGAFSMGSSNFGGTIIGEATRAAVDSMVGQLAAAAASMPETKVAIKALVADVAGGEIIINVGTAGGVKVGAEYDVMRPGREVRDPATGRVLRRITTRVGTLKITSADEQSATGTLTGGPAQVGDCVGACPGGN